MSDDVTRRSGRNRERKTSTDTDSRGSADARTCPECGGGTVQHEGRGEATCEDCGLVLDEEAIDHGPEWRAFTASERTEKSRVGAPLTELRHDRGLSTNIGWQDKDAYGETVSARKQAQMQRLRTWDERFRTKSAQERNLKEAFGEIERMASAIDLPKPVRETAGVIYRRAVEEDLVVGRSIEGMSTASLYAAARQQSVPRSLSEFARVSRVEEIRIQRAFRYLSRELGLAIEPADPLEFLPKFASRLDVSEEVERVSRDLLEETKGTRVHSGKSPAGLAAAALYAATQLTNEKLTQETVGEAADVSEVTIRYRYQELLEEYENQQ
jgi:transcription initiation factor TFIIB